MHVHLADILSDPETRGIYDKQGLEGLKRARGGTPAGQGNASKAWDEFKPFNKSNKRTEARSSSAQVADAGLEERPADSYAPLMHQMPLTHQNTHLTFFQNK